MRVLFSEIIDEILAQRGETTTSVEPNILASIKRRINQIQSNIYFADAWEWRKEKFYFSSKAPIETGTISVTKGSRSAVLSSAVASDIIKYAYLVVDGKAYKIDPHTAVTTTTFNLSAPYPGDTNTTAEYKIVFPEYLLDPEVSAILNIYNEQKELEVKDSGRVLGVLNGVGKPEEASIVGRTTFDYYKVGSVTVTNGSTTVTGAGTTFTSDMIGMPFTVGEHPELYTVQAVNSPTELILRQEYSGDTGTGKSYVIAPKGSPIIQLRSTPNDVYFYEVEALVYPRMLFNNNDRSRIPNHDPLLHGSLWLALHDIDNKSATRITQAKTIFDLAMRSLKDTYKVITNIKWQSEAEQKFRQVGITGFDPFRRGR